MTTKIINDATTNVSSRYTNVKYIKCNDRVIKFYHEIYNAGESCKIELFDGNSFNHLFGLYDMGFRPSEDASYVSNLIEKQNRTNSIYLKSIKLINLIL